MGWKEFIVRMTEAIAWPLTMGTILFLLRDKLSGLIGRILSIKHKDTELNFSKAMAEIEDKALALPPETEPSGPQVNDLRRLARIVPRAAVTQAWSTLDAEICGIILKSRMKPEGRSVEQSEVYSELKRRGFSIDDIRSIRQLRSARNAMIHPGPEIPMSEEEIDAYIDLASSLTQKLKELGSNKAMDSDKK